MDALSPRHLRLSIKIKTLNESIPKKEEELAELENKYTGQQVELKMKIKKEEKTMIK